VCEAILRLLRSADARPALRSGVVHLPPLPSTSRGRTSRCHHHPTSAGRTVRSRCQHW
jgi:hypothetical protein